MNRRTSTNSKRSQSSNSKKKEGKLSKKRLSAATIEPISKQSRVEMKVQRSMKLLPTYKKANTLITNSTRNVLESTGSGGNIYSPQAEKRPRPSTRILSLFSGGIRRKSPNNIEMNPLSYEEKGKSSGSGTPTPKSPPSSKISRVKNPPPFLRKGTGWKKSWKFISKRHIVTKSSMVDSDSSITSEEKPLVFNLPMENKGNMYSGRAPSLSEPSSISSEESPQNYSPWSPVRKSRPSEIQKAISPVGIKHPVVSVTLAPGTLSHQQQFKTMDDTHHVKHIETPQTPHSPRPVSEILDLDQSINSDTDKLRPKLSFGEKVLQYYERGPWGKHIKQNQSLYKKLIYSSNKYPGKTSKHLKEEMENINRKYELNDDPTKKVESLAKVHQMAQTITDFYTMNKLCCKGVKKRHINLKKADDDFNNFQSFMHFRGLSFLLSKKYSGRLKESEGLMSGKRKASDSQENKHKYHFHSAPGSPKQSVVGSYISDYPISLNKNPNPSRRLVISPSEILSNNKKRAGITFFRQKNRLSIMERQEQLCSNIKMLPTDFPTLSSKEVHLPKFPQKIVSSKRVNLCKSPRDIKHGDIYNNNLESKKEREIPGKSPKSSSPSSSKLRAAIFRQSSLDRYIRHKSQPELLNKGGIFGGISKNPPIKGIFRTSTTSESKTPYHVTFATTSPLYERSAPIMSKSLEFPNYTIYNPKPKSKPKLPKSRKSLVKEADSIARSCKTEQDKINKSMKQYIYIYIYII